MFVDCRLRQPSEVGGKDALVWRDEAYSYDRLLEQVGFWRRRLSEWEVDAGSVVLLEADYSLNGVALLLALIEGQCIVVPASAWVERRKAEFMDIAQVEVVLTVDGDDGVKCARLARRAEHAYYAELRRLRHPGLVVFSSGSTGKSKAAVHDAVRLLERFRAPGRSLRTLAFFLYDHIGGLNVAFYTLSNAGCLVAAGRRGPDDVLAAVERHKVELLPSSPTFLNLMLLSRAYERHDLSCLKVISYGTEPMPESTLKRLHEVFPHLRLKQAYGMSELGSVRSKSKSSDSLWVKLSGEGMETRVVDGVLQIKAGSAMLGYLNAPSSFTEDGWLITSDEVETDGEYVKILGRRSEIINVGGEKVYPVEVESVIREMDDVREATVFGEANPLLGQIVCANVTVRAEVDAPSFKIELTKHCQKRLQACQVPVKISIVSGEPRSARLKKVRPLSEPDGSNG